MNTSLPLAGGAAAADEKIINPLTHMDAVTLRVGDLEQMSGYYASALTLEPLEERSRGTEVHRVLGRGATPMLRLIHRPDLPVGSSSSAGLYHTAFLFENQRSLAATALSTFRNPLSRFAGSSDHGVSEAFYFTDPEGNGIELYTDRPRDQWQYARDQIVMFTEWLDPNLYLNTHLTEEYLAVGPAEAGTVGHVHLQVGDIPTAEAFYVDGIGFEPTLYEFRGALFASAGGYHHHVAMNTWHSAGAGPRAVALGLGNVAITVPGREDLDALVARLTARRISFADDGRSVTANDPWGTAVTVALPDSSATDLLDR